MSSDVTACARAADDQARRGHDVLKAAAWRHLAQDAVASSNRTHKVVKTPFKNEMDQGLQI
jgi:hypothetical protein